MDRVAKDQRTSVGSGLDLILGDVGKGDTRDLLVTFLELDLVALYQE